MKAHQYYIYITTTTGNKVLYTGVANNLAGRCHEHKNGLIKGFTKKYNINKGTCQSIGNILNKVIH